jgi:hypothetical protein
MAAMHIMVVGYSGDLRSPTVRSIDLEAQQHLQVKRTLNQEVAFISSPRPVEENTWQEMEILKVEQHTISMHMWSNISVTQKIQCATRVSFIKSPILRMAFHQKTPLIPTKTILDP